MTSKQFLPVLVAVAWAGGCLSALGQTSTIRKSNGEFAPSESGLIRIDTPGDVVVRGHASGKIRYSVRASVSARHTGGIEVSPRNGNLRVRHESAISSRVELFLPRRLPIARIRTGGGNIEVYDFDGIVDAASAGGTIRMDRIGGSVLAQTGGGGLQFGVVKANVRVLSAGGSIRVNSVGGESWFETAGGEIFLGESYGPVYAVTGGGNISVGRAHMAVRAQTAGGSIEIGSAPGVLCESTEGLIRLQSVSGALRAISNAGSILAELVAGRPLLDSILSTAVGDINVLIPSNTPVTVRAQSTGGRSGRIISEFAEIPVRVSASAMLAEGTLNGGGPLLQISAMRGTIYLRRRK